MKKLKVLGLTGIIMSSKNPSKLASFYKEVLGIPLELKKHGNLPEHWECDYKNIHYAILKRRGNSAQSNNVVPSFAVENIEEFVEQHQLEMLHPIIDLGEGSYVGSFEDTDGNTIRLWAGSEV